MSAPLPSPHPPVRRNRRWRAGLCDCGHDITDLDIHPALSGRCAVCGCWPGNGRIDCRCVDPACPCPDPTRGGTR